MTHRIKQVIPLENFVVLAIFQNGAEKEYDMKQLFDRFPQFHAFEKEEGLFEKVSVDAKLAELEAELISLQTMATGYTTVASPNPGYDIGSVDGCCYKHISHILPNIGIGCLCG